MGKLLDFLKKGAKTFLDFSREIITSRFGRLDATTMFENEIFSDKPSSRHA